ncbi:MAG: hypothetical protein CM1200mP15_19610 [Dehalococcoidia bacterium]|nr:MAG: hypothetical protein CM1200mP15_19610 [Dehalococcoidia bacterium]
MLRIQGAQKTQDLEDLEIPQRFIYVPEDFPDGDPFNVGQMYAFFSKTIQSGYNSLPTFDTAVDLHKFLDKNTLASTTGNEQNI